MILDAIRTPVGLAICTGAAMVGCGFVFFFLVNALYLPRSPKEWYGIFSGSRTRARLRERKRRLDAIRSRRPGAILPGIPTSKRDFALEPLIRNGNFKAAKQYIMEQIRRMRDAPEGNGRMQVYVQYLELIEGTH